MKKILTLLSMLTVAAPIATTVQSCSFPNFSGKKLKDPNFDKYGVDNDQATQIQNLVKATQVKNKAAEQVLTTNTGPSSRLTVTGKDENISTIANKAILKVNTDTKPKFTPYADAGIVQDTAEYAMKQKGVGGSHRDEVNERFEQNGIKNIDYSIKGYKDHAGTNYQGVKLGFMQNASDTGELLPMWNAAPAQVSSFPNSEGILAATDKGTEYADWFNSRIDGWLGEGAQNAKDITISFGPFANSFWHTAWQNNKTPEELADAISKIGERYNTKKFEFYFAAPYSGVRGDYFDSQTLLASALKILLENNHAYDFTLAQVVSTQDGIAVSSDTVNTVLGDEASALYSFTKYLGMNFRLNLIPYLTVSEFTGGDKADQNPDWEIDVIKNAITATQKVWLDLHKKINGNTSMTTEGTYNRMGITPWIGRRAEKAAYNFTPEDAKELRDFAIDKNLGNISMFYISRDVPSEYMQKGTNANNYADENALDQNIRSGSGYAQYTYDDILSGKSTVIPDSEAKSTAEIKKIGGIDYFEMLDSVDGIYDEGGDWTTPGVATPNPDGSTGSGSGTITDPNLPDQTPSGMGKSLLKSWQDANPNRNSNITEKSTVDKGVYFSPYIDAGLYSGNEIKDIKTKSGLDHLTLAFVQQANANDSSMELSIAGTSKSGDAYDWWKQGQLWDKMLKPLAEAGNFTNIKTAYGGAITGGYWQKNPWDFALNNTSVNPSKDVNKAVDLLEAGLVGFQQELVDLAKANNISASMPKSIDFDIEGAAQSRDEANVVLAKTLAKMKKADSSWDFSVTLPVLPTGLTSVGYNVMDIFVKEFQKAGLSYNDLPIINLMLMDYGDPIYRQAIANNLTNFDLAWQAIVNTRDNLATSVYNNYGVKATGDNALLNKIGATPMIGVNDTVWGVFTLEDAKELFNYANDYGIGYLSMWSMNDDRGLDFYSHKPVNKSLLSHGLAYLNEYDFAKALNGNWDDAVKRPKAQVS